MTHSKDETVKTGPDGVRAPDLKSATEKYEELLPRPFHEKLIDLFLRPVYRFIPRKTIFQFIKFGIVGVVGFGTDYIFYHMGLDTLGFGHYWSALFSFPFAVTVTWVGNRFFTFRGLSSGSVHHEWARFAMVCLVGLVINRGTFMTLTATVPLVYTYPVLGLLGGTAVAMFFNFAAAKKLVFK